jgi:NAD-dependent SIR2 family protein deacetylase
MDEKRPNLILAVDAFVRSLTVSRQSGHVCFLGAGASVSSGVPCAESCIWEWKRSIFLSNNPGLEDQFSELSIPSVKERIQKWIDSCGSYPARGDADEYGIYVEECYPISSDRRQYFQNLVEEAKPHVGYQLLALLAKAGVIPSVWTTNFDRLLSSASMLVGTTVVEVGLDTVPRLTRQMRRGELRYVALHGDYRYDALKNTGTEIQKQDEELRRSFVEEIRKQNLIVVGYSGRDKSILDSLREAYRESGSSRLYWCGYDEPEPNTNVQSLLCDVREYGHEAYYVPTFGFDDLLQRISLHCQDGKFKDKVRELQSGFGESTLKPVPFRIEAPYTGGIIKSNTFAIRCPKEVLQFEASGFDREGAWRRLREQIEGLPVVAGLLRGKVLALGTIADVESAFHDNLRGTITLTPIDEREMSFVDGVVVGLLRCALVRSIAEVRGLKTDGKRLIWRNVGGQTVSAFGTRCTAYNAAILSLRRFAGDEFLVIKPTVRGTSENGEEISKEMQQEVKRQLLTKQYNRQFNQAIEFWREVIFSEGTGVFEFPPNVGGLFKFEVKPIPVF